MKFIELCKINENKVLQIKLFDKNKFSRLLKS